MFDSLQSQLGKLLGKREDDPQQTITADQLKVVLKSIEGKYNNLKNENKLYKSKIEEQKNAIAELEKAIAELKGGGAPADASLLTQLESDLDAARQQSQDSQELLGSLRAEKLQLQSKLSVQEALVSSLRHEMSELREGHAGLASPEDHAKALARLDKLGFDNQTLQEKIQELTMRLVEAEGLQPELLKQQQAMIGAQQDLAEIKQQLEAAQQAKRQADMERDGVMARMEPLIDELDGVRDELHGMQDKVNAAHAERDALAHGDADRTTAIAELQAALASSADESVQLQMDKDELKHQLQRQQSELEALQEQLNAGGPQGELIAELEHKLVEARTRAEQGEQENLALQERVQELLDEPQGMNTREKTELEFAIKRLMEELRDAALQIGSLREAKVKANLDLEEAAAELVELRRQLDDMRRDRNTFRERLDERRAENDEMSDMKAQMREVMQEMSRLRDGTGGQAAPGQAEAPTPTPPASSPEAASQGRVAEIPGASLARRREMLNRLIGDRKQS